MRGVAKEKDDTGLDRLRELATSPPEALAAARQTLSEARQREASAHGDLDAANALDPDENPTRRRRTQDDAAEAVYAARRARKQAEQDVRVVAQQVWQNEQWPEVVEALTPVLGEFSQELGKLQRFNNKVREAGQLAAQARPRELTGTGMDFVLSWAEFADSDVAKLSTWRAFVAREFGIQL